MIGLCMAVLLVVGALWVAGALLGLAFKLAFVLVGGLFGLAAGAVGLLLGGIALLVAAPFVALALLPLCLPVLLLAALVWAVARGTRRAPAARPSP